MADWGAMKDLEPFITWCPARRRRRRRRRFNLPVAEVCLDQYFVASHCWCPLQIRGIDSHLGRMLALHCQNQRCVRSTFCLKCVDMDFVAEAEMRGRCADRPPCHDNVKIWKPFVITRDSTISATLATQKVHYHMCVVPQTAHPFTQIRLQRPSLADSSSMNLSAWLSHFTTAGGVVCILQHYDNVSITCITLFTVSNIFRPCAGLC